MIDTDVLHMITFSAHLFQGGNLLMNDKRLYGCSDTPLDGKEKNKLGTEKYIAGLENFIKGCCTPMSIALQGDWGTGKTSFINTMLNDFEKDEDITALYFNTWQYSQFKMSEDLYSSFIISIMNHLKKDHIFNSDSAKNVARNALHVVYGLGKQYAEKKLDVNLDDIDAIVMRECEKATKVSNMKKNFADLIAESAGKGRVVIFVDDLDRLNPEVAVELLEVMKLFMDVPQCVFVLAIDYEVVVKGIRNKYGADMSDDKCRSFFDKIIQLPFRMPVESYTISELIKDNVGDKMAGYEKLIANVIRSTLGPNPRTFKRLFNSYELLTLVQNRELKDYEAALLLISLILQMQSSVAFKELIDVAEDKESFEKFQSEYENYDILKKEDKECLFEIFNGIEEVRDIATAKDKNTDITQAFLDILNLSSITSVNPAKSAKNSATRVTGIEVLGESVSVANPTEAVARTFEIVLSHYPDKINSLLQKYPKMISSDPKISTGIFVANKRLEVAGYPNGLVLGTKTGYHEKCRQVLRLCSFLNTPDNCIKWYSGNSIIFEQ